MRFFLFFCWLLLASTSHSQWQSYPNNLQQFDYTGDKLAQNWPTLAAATGLPWPDAQFIESMMLEFPDLAQRLKVLAQAEGASEALKASLKKDYHPLALAVQQVWRLHYEGKYQQAYETGLTLGPAGIFPAMYAKLIHTTYLIKDKDIKAAQFEEVDKVISDILPFANNYAFILFGDAYQKARRLELMSTTAATASGLLGPTQDNLRALHQADPNNPLYSAMLAGIDAGIIERVGNFVGGMTYGADEDKALQLFQSALAIQPNLAVLYHEFSQVLLRLDNSDHEELLSSTLASCLRLEVSSAEEALNQLGCKNLKQALDQ
jgi:hypothetical protein